ncbi:MAG: LysM peptidoglycan-binding domain-containing protein [Lachnospiraceae bacterium]|nr:LysM peptidoglycan-binding domain-containing protein [Lachnospiraceae bacterium]
MKKSFLFRYAMVLGVSILMFMSCFFLFFSSPVSADSGRLHEMKGYESVLIRDGDTLSSLAYSYAPVKSHMSENEYLAAVISLNNMSSEYIRAGEYLLIPDFL